MPAIRSEFDSLYPHQILWCLKHYKDDVRAVTARNPDRYRIDTPNYASVAELVDALVLGTSTYGCEGSSPS